MRPNQKPGIFAPWQFIAILLTLSGFGLFLNPDLLQYYTGKPDLIITEFLADNQSQLTDADGDYSDWIEIYNASEDTIPLKGWHLTDDFKNYRQWTFPQAQLEPGGFLLVWASGKNRTNWIDDLHTNFKLSSEGEYLALIRPDGKIVAHEYLPKYPKQKPDISFGLNNEHFQDHKWLSKEPLRDYSFFGEPTPLKPNHHGAVTPKHIQKPSPEERNPAQQE